MSQEEDLKRVELKVTVNCCEGCKRKVLKALSIKGVLKTEVHPTLPKVTVTGDVDAQMLISKLAKRGKKAELWPKEPKPDKDVRVPERVSKEREENNEKDFEDDKRNVKTIDNKVDRSIENSIPNGSPNQTVSTDTDTPNQTVSTDTDTTSPHQVNPSIVPPMQSCVYYRIESHPVPMTYYSTANADAVVNANLSVTPPCCHQYQHHYELPVYHRSAAVEASQSTNFADYFNDENAVGCCVM